MNHIPLLSFWLMTLMCLAQAGGRVHPSQGGQDPAKGIIARQKAEFFLYPQVDDIVIGDTITILPKRVLSDGSLVDFPSLQLFDVRFTVGKSSAWLVFPNGRISNDTSIMRAPIRWFTRGTGTFEWEIFALNVDTSNEYLMRPRGSKEMVRTLTAPNRPVLADMLQRSGYLKLNAGNYEGARECFKDAMKQDLPRSGDFMYDVACSFALENNTSESLRWLRNAIDSGYHQYIHALKNDTDLRFVRSQPEFYAIVTSPLAKKREGFLKEIKEHPDRAGRAHFDIARSYLEQADVDSFFVSFESALKNGYLPGYSTFLRPEYNAVKKDPRLDSLILRYGEEFSSRVFPEFDALQNPAIVKRLECDQDLKVIAKFPNLVELRITRESRGELPSDLANLKQLQSLRFIDCAFQSFQTVLPSFVNLDTLTADAGASKFLPDNFGDLVRLRQLWLLNGRLEGLPASFRGLKQLTDLSLSSNALPAVPPEVFTLGNLESLDLSGNSIIEIPRALESLSLLKSLSFAENRVARLPGAIGRLTNLTYLDLSLNCLSEIPEEFGNLRRLEELDLSFNELKRMPQSIGMLQSLEKLNVYGNQLDTVEIERLHHLLPRCRIIDEHQNAFRRSPVVPEMSYSDPIKGISFRYPKQFTLQTRKGKKDSSETVIELTHQEIGEQEIDSVNFKFRSDAVLTIRFSRDRFEASASDAGIERNERFSDTTDVDDSTRFEEPPWVSLGRQGMQEDVSVISYDGWRGFYGTNSTGRFGESDDGRGSGYQGLEDFSVAFARKKLGLGICVSVSFWSTIYEDDDIFQEVLSSIRLSASKPR